MESKKNSDKLSANYNPWTWKCNRWVTDTNVASGSNEIAVTHTVTSIIRVHTSVDHYSREKYYKYNFLNNIHRYYNWFVHAPTNENLHLSIDCLDWSFCLYSNRLTNLNRSSFRISFLSDTRSEISRSTSTTRVETGKRDASTSRN